MARFCLLSPDLVAILLNEMSSSIFPFSECGINPLLRPEPLMRTWQDA